MATTDGMVKVQALFGAALVSGFVTIYVGLLPVGALYPLDDGMSRDIVVAILSLATLGFFLWFGRHAYRREVELIKEDNLLKRRRDPE